MIVIIPAYQPDDKLLALIEKIKRLPDYTIIVVNDGSDESNKDLFSMVAVDAIVLSHAKNKGKGRAIKTALAYIWEHLQDEMGIVIMDADSQHTPEDMVAVSRRLLEYPEALVIGARQFSKHVPFRSRFGNEITKILFGLMSGKFVQDTQTGLRAFSKKHIPFFLGIEGERYEFEMNMLLSCVRNHMEIVDVPIQTVYLDKKIHPLIFVQYEILQKYIALSLSSRSHPLSDF